VRIHHELRFFLGFFKGKGETIALSIALSCMQSLAILPIVLLVNRIIDEALPERNFSLLLASIASISAFALAGGIIQLLNRGVSIRIIKSAVSGLRTRLVKTHVGGSRKYYSREDLDMLHSRIVQDTYRVDAMAGALLTQTIPGSLITAGFFFVLFSLNPVLTLVCAGISPVFAAVVLLMSRRLKVLIQAFHRDFSRYSKGVKFMLESNELIRISTAESFEEKRQGKTIEDLRVSQSAALWFSSVLHVGQQQLLMMSGAAILLVGGYFVLEGSLSLGQLIAFYAALGMLNGNARSVIDSIPTLVEGFESLRVLRGILEEAQGGQGGVGELGHRRGAGSVRGVAEAAAESGIGDAIVFDKVSFRYQDSDAPLIQDMDFTLRLDRNEIVNIHGLSGTGKSTLMYLLLGFYEPDSGRILVDGVDLKELSLERYRRQIGVVLQDPLVFAGTVRENITYGLDAWDESELAEVCREAMIHEDIQHLEKGLDTMIGENGMTLSGGQRQRIAIARALLRKPGLLILDEPTNHLDEALIEAMGRLWSRSTGRAGPGRACIVISHDKILKELADSSYVLKDGRLMKSASG